jgi:hypothetical protein
MACILTFLLLPVSWPSADCIPTPPQSTACSLPLSCLAAFILSCILTFMRPYTLNHLQPVSWPLRSVSWPLSCLYPDPSAALYPVLVHPLLSFLFCILTFLRPFTLNLLQPVSWPLRSVSWLLSCVNPDPSADACILTPIRCLRPDFSAECILTSSRPSHLIGL